MITCCFNLKHENPSSFTLVINQKVMKWWFIHLYNLPWNMSFSPRVWCQRKMAGVRKWSLTDKLVVVESSETHLRSLLLIPPSFHRGFAGCCLIPFFMDQLRDVHHQCPNCKEHIHTFQPLWLGCVICTAWSVTSLLEWQLPEVSELFGTRPWHSFFFFFAAPHWGSSTNTLIVCLCSGRGLVSFLILQLTSATLLVLTD